MNIKTQLQIQKLTIERDEWKKAFNRENRRFAKLQVALMVARLQLKKRQPLKRKAPVLKIVA